MINWIAIISFVSGLVILIIGIGVYQRNPHSRTSMLFTLLSILLAYSGFLDYNFRVAPDFESASEWLRYSAVWLFSVAVFIHLFLVFTEHYALLRKKRTLLAVYGPTLFFFLVDHGSGLISGTAVLRAWGWDVILPHNVFSHLCSLWSLTGVIIMVVVSFRYYRRAKQHGKKKRAWFAFLGIIFGSFFAFTTALILPYCGIASPNLAMPSYLIAFTIVGYGILKHRLFILSTDTSPDTIIDTISDMIILVNEEQKIAQINPTALKVLQYDESQVLGEPVENVLPFFKQEIVALHKAGGKQGTANPFVNEKIETTMLTRTGRSLVVILSFSMIYNNEKRLLSTICIARDITEFKEAKRRHAQSETRYRLLVESAPLGIMSVDPRGYITDVNQGMLNLIGGDIEHIIGMNIKSMIHLQKCGFNAKYKQCLELSEPIIAVSTVEMGQDIRRHMKYYLTPILGEDKAVVSILAIIEDITEEVNGTEALQKAKVELEERVEERTLLLKVANTKLGEEKERLSVTLHSIADGVVTTNGQGLIELVNKVAEELVGVSFDEMYGKPFDEMFVMQKENADIRCESPVAEVIRTHEVVTGKSAMRLCVRDGSTKIVSHSAAPIHDKLGNITGVVFVIRDMTDVKRVEEELFQARKLESICQLVSSIASDFNDSLSNVITNLFAAKMHVPVGGDVYHFFQEAEKSAFNASSLTKQLITFSERERIITSRISIDTLLDGSVGFVLNNPHVDYQLDLAPDLKDVEVDRGQMDQLINILVGNAEHAMPRGGVIHFEAKNLTVNGKEGLPLQPGIYVQLAIRDEGVGIARQDIAKIFEPFFTTNTESVGLGLYLAYAIIRRHKGHISVDSQQGKGTTVMIYLPAIGDAEEYDNEKYN